MLMSLEIEKQFCIVVKDMKKKVFTDFYREGVDSYCIFDDNNNVLYIELD